MDLQVVFGNPRRKKTRKKAKKTVAGSRKKSKLKGNKRRKSVSKGSKSMARKKSRKKAHSKRKHTKRKHSRKKTAKKVHKKARRTRRAIAKIDRKIRLSKATKKKLARRKKLSLKVKLNPKRKTRRKNPAYIRVSKDSLSYKSPHFKTDKEYANTVNRLEYLKSRVDGAKDEAQKARYEAQLKDAKKRFKDLQEKEKKIRKFASDRAAEGYSETYVEWESKARKKKKKKKTKKSSKRKGSKRRSAKKSRGKIVVKSLRQAKRRVGAALGKLRRKKSVSIEIKGKTKKQTKRFVVRRSNPMSLVSGLIGSETSNKIEEFTGIHVDAFAGLALGGASVPLVEKGFALLAQKVPAIAPAANFIAKYPLTLPLLAGIALHYAAKKVPQLKPVSEGLLGASAVGLGMMATQTFMPMAGVNYTPLSGVNYTPLSGVNYTPLSGQMGYGADFGKSPAQNEDYGGGGGYTDRHRFSDADFGAEDDGNYSDEEELESLGGQDGQMG